MATLPWRCAVTGDRWKLNLCAGDQCELFDLNNDLYEETNLFDNPTHRDRAREIAARIRLWQHETNDHAPLPRNLIGTKSKNLLDRGLHPAAMTALLIALLAAHFYDLPCI